MKKLLVLLLLPLLLFTACRRQIFDGSNHGNDTEFVLEYRILNETLTHEMKLNAGAVIDVDITAESGRVDVLVTSGSGKTVYKGDNASAGSFKIEITEAGTYTFSVTGKKAKGGVSFIAEK